MRRLICTVLALLSLPAIASEYCVIPELQAGVPVEVAVDRIGKTLCGMAIIEKRYVRLEQEARHKRLGPVRCNHAGSDCRQRADYFLSERDSVPYIVIFRGPRTGDPG